MSAVDPVWLFERATARAAAVMGGVSPGQLGEPTLCAEWTVQQLIDHMDVAEGLRRPGALDRTCLSPLGFTWSIGQAAAGTFMDNLIHTWDLATATGQDRNLDGELVDACVAMFLPEMPERGRSAGLVGPAVPMPAGASAHDRLLGAMGRRP